MDKEIKLNLNKQFYYVISREFDRDTAKHYTPLLNDEEKQEITDIILKIRLSNGCTWSVGCMAKIAPYLLKFAPIPYKGISYIKPITNLEMLDAEERYSMISKWEDFDIQKSFFLYEKDGIRALVMVEKSESIQGPKIIDPNDYLNPKQRYTILAEMNALMAEQS